MSKSVATESKESHEIREMSGEKGADDEEEEDRRVFVKASSAATSSTLTTVSTVPATTDQFMFTNDFKMLLVGFVHVQTLMVLRVTTKAWKRVAYALIDEGVRSRELMVHGGKIYLTIPHIYRRGVSS